MSSRAASAASRGAAAGWAGCATSPMVWRRLTLSRSRMGAAARARAQDAATVAPSGPAEQPSDDCQLASHAAEDLQARVELVARVLGRHDGAHAALLLGHGREADAH